MSQPKLELVDFLKAKETDPYRLHVIGMHVQAEPPYLWLCALCRDEGQNLDCTYPCDFLRVYGERWASDPGYRDEWRV